MAETAVCFIIEKLLALLTRESQLLGDLPRELKALSNELGSIRVFLKDAEEQAEQDEGVKEWVRQVRNVAYEIEDVVDQHAVLFQPQNYGYHDYFLRFVKEPLQPFKQVSNQHSLANAIKGINSEILQIARRRKAFNFRLTGCDGSKNRCRDLRISSLHVNESELVGIDISKQDIVRLLNLEKKDSPRSVVSIVGMGGLGKTTLTRKIYDDLIEEHFPFYAWVTVSRSYKLEDILRNMIKQLLKVDAEESAVVLKNELLSEDEVFLIDELRKYLDDKRYLVIFDDVWQMELWTHIKSALPDNNKGSMIIVTTRSKDASLFWRDSPDQGHVYKLQPLSPEKAQELFCKKTFQGSEIEESNNPEMEELSREIVRKCHGLPLAIVAIGGLLSTKSRTVSEWRKLLNSLGSELGSNPHLTEITRVLLLSYHDLDYYLKPCLLYFSLFPEDYQIDKMRLLRLWIAEGFVRKSKGKTLEETAEEYLLELIQRSLVQISRVDRHGRAKCFQVHDLMREVILSKSEDLSFYLVLKGEGSTAEGQIRRLAIHNGGVHARHQLERVKSDSNIRSFFLFEGKGATPERLIGRFLKSTCLLKVLDLQDSRVNHLPKEVEKLHHLQYLSLRNTAVKKLPRSIGKLYNLQTLDLKQSLIDELPEEVRGLKKLRHLLAYHCWNDPLSLIQTTRGVKIPKGVLGNFEQLQKLACVDGGYRGNLAEELRNLNQLRKLAITHLRIKDWAALCISIEAMIHLRTLMLTTINKDEILHLEFINSPPALLEKLYLKGGLDQIPKWITGLNSVVCIYLRWSRLKEDPLKILQAMPKLQELHLTDAYVGKGLHFSMEGFPKLKLLSIYEMKNLNLITIEAGALPFLSRLSIGTTPKLEQVPLGIQNLKNLTSLTFIDMPAEFVNCTLQGDTTKYTFEVYFYNKADGYWELCTLQ